MERTKRFISLLLVFLIAYNVPIVSKAEVVLGHTLILGERDPMPGIGPTSTTPTETAYLEWDITNNGEYILDYPIASGASVKFIFNRTGTNAEVSYTVLDHTNTSIFPAPPINNPAGYEVNIGNFGGLTGFVPAKEYIDKRQSVDPTDNGTVYDGDHPSFTVSAGKGFSFRYSNQIVHNQTVHFVWGEPNTLRFYTELTDLTVEKYQGILNGNIYPFTLTHNGVVRFTEYVFNGVDFSKLTSTPIDKDGNKADNNHILVQNGTIDDPNPGTAPVGLIIDFPMPNAWNNTKKVFEPLSSASVIDGTVKSNFILSSEGDGTPDNPNIYISLFGADLKNNPTGWTINTESSNMLKNVEIVDAGKTVRFTLNGLPPSRIFDYASILIEGTSNSFKEPDSIRVPGTRFYTFLSYLVHYDGWRYNISVVPYKGYSGDYKLLESSKKPDEPYKPYLIPPNSSVFRSNGTEQVVFLPMTTDPSNGMHYQVYFIPSAFADEDNPREFMYSQILHYTPHGDIELGKPTFFDANVIKMDEIPDSTGGMNGRAGDLEMSFRWDIGSVNTIDTLLRQTGDQMDIEYELAFNTTRRIGNNENTIYKHVTLSIRNTDPNDPSKTTKLEVKYQGDGVINGETWYPLQAETDPVTNMLHYYIPMDNIMRMRIKTALKDSGEAGELVFPSIYYATIRPTRRAGVPITFDLSSNEDSFTLDGFITMDIPTPQSLTLGEQITSSGENNNEVSFAAQWRVNGDSLRQYLNTLPESLRNNTKLSMNLYISMNEAYMRDVFGGYVYEDRIKDSEPDFKTVRYSHAHEYYERYPLYFSKPNDVENDLSPVGGANGYSNARDALRKGKTVMITGLPATDFGAGTTELFRIYKLDGLDKNEKYYVYVDIVAEHYDENGNLMLFRPSNTSNIVGITTLGDREVPTGEEKIPSAPKGLLIKSQNFGEATIQWDKVESPSVDEVLEYQIIRVEDSQMDSKYLSTTEPYNNYWSNYLNGFAKKGWQTVWPDTIKAYDGVEFGWEDPQRYIYDSYTNAITLTDKTLIPNKLYFYYIRTVKTVGEVTTFSTWSHLTLTTDPVKSPENLRVEINRDDYDPRSEIIISFDAPLPDISSLGNPYILQYQLKKEGEDWGEHVEMPSSKLLQSFIEADKKGYFHFEFKIEGLSHSTSYMVRVRMIDQYDGSLYSNIEQFRTQFIQDDYDEQKNLNDWLYYLKEQLLKLLNDPTWATADTTTAMETVIRPSMWNELAAQSADVAVLLPRSQTHVASYLIPSSVLDAANSAGRGFRIAAAGGEVIIAPNSIDQNQNQAMADILGMLRQNNIADYSLRVTLTLSDATEPINGETAQSKIINVRFELVGAKTPLNDWDGQTLRDFTAFIDEFMEDSTMRSDFNTRIKTGDNESLVRHVDDLIRQAKSKYLNRTANSYANTISAAFEIDTLQRPVTIVVPGVDPVSSVRAYHRQSGQWVGVEHGMHGTDYVIYTQRPGGFVFAGSALEIPGLIDMPDAGTLTRIITKYALDDYLGKGGFDLKKNASRLMIAGSVARIMGAPRESDPYDWLSRNKNISLIQRNMNAEITAQEAAYLAAALYEAKSGVKIESVQVRNYNLTAGISGLDERYLMYVRAAGELGIVDLNNFTPGAAITIKDALQMIDAVDIMLKL